MFEFHKGSSFELIITLKPGDSIVRLIKSESDFAPNCLRVRIFSGVQVSIDIEVFAKEEFRSSSHSIDSLKWIDILNLTKLSICSGRKFRVLLKSPIIDKSFIPLALIRKYRNVGSWLNVTASITESGSTYNIYTSRMSGFRIEEKEARLLLEGTFNSLRGKYEEL